MHCVEMFRGEFDEDAGMDTWKVYVDSECVLTIFVRPDSSLIELLSDVGVHMNPDGWRYLNG